MGKMRLPDLSPKLLAGAFVLYAALMTAIVLIKLPAFMGPDELNHLRRAELLSHGMLIGKRETFPDGVVAGGPADKALDRASDLHMDLPYKQTAHLPEEKRAEASELRWSQVPTDVGFENTAVYPPVFYLPSSLAIVAGKALNLPVLTTITVARGANALACLMVGAWALLLARKGAAFLFALLLLPMSAFLYSTVTQDGLLIATAALAGSLIARARFEDRLMTRNELIGCAIALVLIATAKPPYALLCLALLLAPLEKRAARIASGTAFAITLAWHGLIAACVQTPLKRADVALNASGQVHHLLTHPWAIFPVALVTLKHSLFGYGLQFIGLLSWLDTPLPKTYYVLAAVFLIAASLTLWPKAWSRQYTKGTLLAALTVCAVFLGLYVAYSPVAGPEVDGIQGRYFLPIAAFLPALFSAPQSESRPLPKWATAAILAFPLLTVVVITRVLSLRYW